MKQLAEWVTGLKNKYRTHAFFSTWVNIIVFHTFFVLTMAVVFYFTLDHIKATIFTTIIDLLKSSLAGVPPDVTALDRTSVYIDTLSLYVLIGIVAFAIITSIIAAFITIKPTSRALAMQKHFISSIAHELRTPLAILRTSNEVALYDLENDSPLRETIVNTIRETKHLTNVLNNLLILNRVDTTQTMPFSTVDLSDVALSVQRKLASYAEKKHVVIETALLEDVKTNGNRSAIEQALYNLAKNAVTYSKPQGGVVQISTQTSTHNTVSLKVVDHGIGIEPKELPNIFSPFYRVNDARGEGDSMGLGLALVYEVMRIHKGRIVAHSTPQEGTTIELIFSHRKTAVSDNSEQKGTLAFDFKH